MTDKEIIKAFEYCVKNEECSLCPLFRKCPTSFELQKQALDLINRQQAEIERLQTENNQFADIGKLYSEIKTEAIKEFAERLKENLIEESYDDVQFFKVVGESDIDNLVKEMVGDTE